MKTTTILYFVKKWRNIILRNIFGLRKTLDKDIILAKVHKISPSTIKIGTKVITDRGIAYVVNTKPNDWLVLSFKNKNFIERKREDVTQYVASWKNPFTFKKYQFPLAYADYDYMDQSKDKEHVRIYITRKKYAKLIEEEQKGRAYLKYFYSVKGGHQILQKFTKDNVKIIQKGSLILIKK